MLFAEMRSAEVRQGQIRAVPRTGSVGPVEAARIAGEIWASVVINDRLTADLPTDISHLPPAAREGAARLLIELVPEHLDLLRILLDDSVSRVRSAAGAAASSLAKADSAAAEDLLAAISNSAAFADCFGNVLHALAERSLLLPASTLQACEYAAKAIATRSAGAARVGYDLSRLIFRLYQQTDDPDSRRRCLDVIDQLAQNGTYGLSQLLDSQR
ncbi:hypothetical protein [Kribbella jiaozuonensis]|uniref:HEAT repeat protein n=1 Tax=Kribbella jiaozuonensis TaxID=2575441 RepID=A0A4U3M5Z9_9ACTN|nr:hypothetical protein [Kribbella jiaozuonensis]TKK82827.1 hypothetical protein FDA38_08730 [Kribbella jiaozuonensis]